jgi:dihydroxyacetone kinase-like protein
MQITEINYAVLTKMLLSTAALVIENKDHLGKLDAAIGDGDHGVTMERVMQIVTNKINESSNENMSVLLQDIAWALMDCGGGATGPLYGSFFLGMSDAIVDKTVLDSKSFAQMFEGGMQAIMQQTKAKVGDKTMMDALIPAVEAALKNADEESGIFEVLQAATEAAKAGSEYTATIPARFGRAKFQGDRTLGHPDPGSVSITLVFQGLLNGLIQDN